MLFSLAIYNKNFEFFLNLGKKLEHDSNTFV